MELSYALILSNHDFSQVTEYLSGEITDQILLSATQWRGNTH